MRSQLDSYAAVFAAAESAQGKIIQRCTPQEKEGRFLMKVIDTEGVCQFCGKSVVDEESEEFLAEARKFYESIEDALSMQEYAITGMCLACQAEIFTPPDEDDEDECGENPSTQASIGEYNDH